MVLLLSSWSLKLLMGFLFGSLNNLAVISKTAFPRLILFYLLFFAKWEFTLRNFVLEITAKLVKDSKRNPMRSFKDQEESSNTIINLYNQYLNFKRNNLHVSFFFIQTPVLHLLLNSYHDLFYQYLLNVCNLD